MLFSQGESTEDPIDELSHRIRSPGPVFESTVLRTRFPFSFFIKERKKDAADDQALVVYPAITLYASDRRARPRWRL